MKSDALEFLAGLEIACRFLHTCLHQAPSDDFLNQLADEQLLNHWPVDSVDDDMSTALTVMKRDLEQESADKLKLLKDDFNGLFVGPHTLKAVPWASVYLTEEQLVMTEPMLAVRQFYRDYGLEIHTGENEPDDHLGLQLAFIAHVLDNLLDGVDQGQDGEYWLTIIRRFLTNHVLTWSGRFLDIMKEGATTDFYRGVAQLTKTSLRQLAIASGAEYRIVQLYR